ncbi:MAG: nucleotide exchange factor GrpE [Rhizobiaceae bacterium]
MAEETEHHGEDATNNNGKSQAGSEPNAAEDNTHSEMSEEAGFSSPLEFLNAELSRLESENAALKEKMLRLAADMENLRRRTQKDVSDAREYSIAGFAREMLAVSDNLRRALETLPAELRESGDAGLTTLIEGVELTERSMLQGLEKHGVRKVSALNERFDPNFHQAMFEIPDTETPNNTVLQVVQDGYVIGERVLRPAMVGVSRGGPKASARDNEETSAEADASRD